MMVLGIIAGAALLFELCVILAAPIGYQDENGFHLESNAGSNANGLGGNFQDQ